MPLFPDLLGDAWPALGAPVRRIHAGAARTVLRGEAQVGGGTHPSLRLLRRLLGLPPPAMRVPVQVTIIAHADAQTWTRQFGRHRMRSILRKGRDGLLHERLGPILLRFALRRDGDGIAWEFRGARLMGLPLPRRVMGEVRSSSGCEAGRYVFSVETRVPRLGPLVAYRGWLEMVEQE